MTKAPFMSDVAPRMKTVSDWRINATLTKGIASPVSASETVPETW